MPFWRFAAKMIEIFREVWNRNGIVQVNNDLFYFS